MTDPDSHLLERIKQELLRLANRPVFGTKVIPKNATVDPAAFPDDEYPVHCPKCAYLLQCLPDGACPECGRPFTRGRLLVEQYVTTPATAWSRTTKSGRICTRISCIVAIVWVVASFAMCAAPRILLPMMTDPTNLTASIQRSQSVLMAIGIAFAVLVALTLAMCSAMIPMFRHYFATRAKRRAVRDAIECASENTSQ